MPKKHKISKHTTQHTKEKSCCWGGCPPHSRERLGIDKIDKIRTKDQLGFIHRALPKTA